MQRVWLYYRNRSWLFTILRGFAIGNYIGLFTRSNFVGSNWGPNYRIEWTPLKRTSNSWIRQFKNWMGIELIHFHPTKSENPTAIKSCIRQNLRLFTQSDNRVQHNWIRENCIVWTGHGANWIFVGGFFTSFWPTFIIRSRTDYMVVKFSLVS